MEYLEFYRSLTKEEKKLFWQIVKPHLILCAEIIAILILIDIGVHLLAVPQ